MPGQRPGGKSQAWQPNDDMKTVGQRTTSRKLHQGWTGDLPLHLDEWFGSSAVPRMGGLRLIETKPKDTLGPAATKAPPIYREPSKRIYGPGMCRPVQDPGYADKPGLRVVPQKEHWRQETKPEGVRKFPPQATEVAKSGGLRIIRDEATGEMFKEKRSQVMSFQDLTGTKRTFRDKPGFKDPAREDPDAFPGMRGRRPDFVEGKLVDYSLKNNGGFLAKKMLPDVTVYEGASQGKVLQDSSNTRGREIGGTGGPDGGGSASHGPHAPSHGHLGRTRAQGVASLLAWG